MLYLSLLILFVVAVQTDDAVTKDASVAIVVNCDPADALACENKPDNSSQHPTGQSWSRSFFEWLFSGSNFETVKEADPVDLSDVSPEMEEILANWQAASRQAMSVNIDFTRSVFNQTFEVERRSEGQLKHQRPGTTILALQGKPPVKGELSLKRSRSGEHYSIEQDVSEIWVWTEREVTVADPDDRLYQVATPPLPRWLDESRFFPFFFEIDSDQLRRKWTLKLVRSSRNKVIIQALPRTEDLRVSFQSCIIQLDTTDWHPSALRCVISEDHEILYKIQNWRPNATKSTGWDWGPEFIDFRSRGYKLISVGK